ncbi:Protein-lysine N-methyltransferase EFM5 [Paraphaeosphaeria minitans]|uniref:Protein-lysine N-methyltransferase EFM5 n=1 Tax=Paraphaeosphaeria minitans TaxID=565426 RepID=A0A9P6GB15_9PLEO|nr:Protein-lysine N-methyltransferase EFM5 [Paraphaeosphaeria minitans]
MAETEDDGPIQLSAGALDALKEFYGERDARAKQFEDLKTQAEDDFAGTLSMEAFTEDWNASQFWYSDETATTLARQLLEGATDDTRIAVVSAPSTFIQLKNLLVYPPPLPRLRPRYDPFVGYTAKKTQASGAYTHKPYLTLLEYDTRFNVFKEFVPYDFEAPLKLPAELKGSFDAVIVDPPFLSDDCQTKAALTVRWLSRSWTPGSAGVKLIACTGERMESLVTRLYANVGVRTTDFEVRHAKGLSNEFRCYANFECGAWKWAKQG